jgi:tripartite-type tricarboxylate transporter receptor subunit TctC
MLTAPLPTLQRFTASETAKAVRTKKYARAAGADGAEPVGNTQAEFAAHINDEMRKWAEVARAAKVEPQ